MGIMLPLSFFLVVTLHGLRLKMHTRPGLKRKKPFRLHLGCTASKPKSWRVAFRAFGLFLYLYDFMMSKPVMISR